MKDHSLYEKAFIPDYSFPISIVYNQRRHGESGIYSHWHEQMELLYFVEGSAVIECNSVPISVKPGDLIVLNSNDHHYMQFYESPLAYYCIIIDPMLFHSGFADTCEVKYISPISRNLILFNNKISSDENINFHINDIISEYNGKNIGYELAIKSSVYKLLVLLLRNHIKKILTKSEYAAKVKNLKRLGKVLTHIENNYMEKISIEELSGIAGLSTFHFCHLFKNITGKSPGEYIISFRMEKAEHLLKNTDMNITEIAMSTGFSDVNYFSRIYKKHKNISPSKARKDKG